MKKTLAFLALLLAACSGPVGPPSSEPTKTPTQIATQEVGKLGLIDRVTDLAMENRDAGLVIAGATGTSIVIVTISHSAARLIEAVRK